MIAKGEPFPGPLSDTCGLDDLQVTIFQQEHYLENFVQATFDALPEDKLTGKGAIKLALEHHG